MKSLLCGAVALFDSSTDWISLCGCDVVPRMIGFVVTSDANAKASLKEEGERLRSSLEDRTNLDPGPNSNNITTVFAQISPLVSNTAETTTAETPMDVEEMKGM